MAKKAAKKPGPKTKAELEKHLASLKIWQVIVSKGVTKSQLQAVLEKYGAFVQFLNPIPVTRTELRNGLRCYRDEELCIYSEGPENLPELVKDEPLINAVIGDRKVTSGLSCLA